MQTARLRAIDTLRGLVIALMVVDHVRDYVALNNFFTQADMAHASPAWYWTRWATHLCAPIFVLLAGASAWLRGQKTGPANLARYLVMRGLILVLLEATWISFCWQLGYNVIVLQVLFALGVGMIFLAVLLQLPRWLIGAIAALLILPHNLFDHWQTGDLFWRAWHEGGYYRLTEHGFGIVFAYPLMPWLGLIAAGYVLGPVFRWDPWPRQRFLLGASALLLAVFVLLRLSNGYGDPLPYTPSGQGWMSELMAFMNLQKYPPSLLYLLATVPVGLAALAWIERLPEVPVITLIGRHPLLFYTLHIIVIRVLAIAYMQLRFGGQPDFDPVRGQLMPPPGFQAEVWVSWAGAALVTLLMYGVIRFKLRLEKRRGQ